MTTEAATAQAGTTLETKHTPATAAMQNIRFRIAGDVIAKACEMLSDEQRAAIKWAAGYCRQGNLTCEEFGQQILQRNGQPYSADSVYAVFTGRRDGGSIENFCRSVEVFRRRMEETTSRDGGVAFVETVLTRRIWSVCRMAFERKWVSFIFGPTQIGKTTALTAYQGAHNHGETVLVRMPTRGSLTDLLEEIAIRLGIPTQQKHTFLKRRIIESFDSRMLLIVDECHQCIGRGVSGRPLDSLDFLREVQDRRKCGLVLCGTDVFKAGLRGHKQLHQLWQRGMRPLQLPTVPSAADMAEFARAHGLPPAEDKVITVERSTEDDRVVRVSGNPRALQDQVLKVSGLGRWCRILEDATETAKERGRKVTWGMVILAHHAWEELEGDAR